MHKLSKYIQYVNFERVSNIPLCSHTRGVLRKTIKRHGLSVYACMVPFCMGIGFVWLVYSPINVVVDCQ